MHVRNVTGTANIQHVDSDTNNFLGHSECTSNWRSVWRHFVNLFFSLPLSLSLHPPFSVSFSLCLFLYLSLFILSSYCLLFSTSLLLHLSLSLSLSLPLYSSTSLLLFSSAPEFLHFPTSLLLWYSSAHQPQLLPLSLSPSVFSRSSPIRAFSRLIFLLTATFPQQSHAGPRVPSHVSLPRNEKQEGNFQNRETM